jgi:UDP-N-acetylglucosamine 2-epimerase (non-hydrolysing)
MVDNLLYQLDKISSVDASAFQSTRLKEKLPRFGVVTLHRPSNVDDLHILAGIMAALNRIAEEIPLVFPVHPRTRKAIENIALKPEKSIVLTQPLSYMDFLNLWKDATLVLTDSGGLQEETTALGIPCLTLRNNTERPITVEEGSNTLVGVDPATIISEAHAILQGRGKAGKRPSLWDGHAAERIVEILEEML